MTRILILYLLLEGSRSGYDLKRILSRPFVRYWFRIEDASIYSVLKTLARRGLAKVSKQGRALSYEITRQGSTEFEQLCEQAWREDFAQNFTAALAVSGDLPASKLRRLVEARRQLIIERMAQFEAIRAGALCEPLARREHRLLGAEIEWLDDEIGRLSQ